MNNIPTPPTRSQHHPLMLLAALAVVLFCLIGSAAIMGWIRQYQPPVERGRTRRAGN